MAEYRAYLFTGDGHIREAQEFVAATDADATEMCRRWAASRPAELWSGARMVARMSEPEPGAAKQLMHSGQRGRIISLSRAVPRQTCA